MNYSDYKESKSSFLGGQSRSNQIQVTPNRRQDDNLSVLSGQSSQKGKSRADQKFHNTNQSVRRSQIFDASKFVCQELDVEEIIQLREVFNRWDQDMSGSLAPNELKLALMQYEKNITNNQINQLLGVIDVEEKGEIDFEYFISIFKKEIMLKFIHKIYNQYDVKQKGFITAQDLSQFTERKLRQQESEETLNQIIKVAGTDGKISKQQFENIMLSYYKQQRQSEQ